MSDGKVVALHGERPRGAEKLADLCDDDLMLLAGGGAREAFAILVERHHGRLTGLCAKLAGAASAEEIAQEVWLRVWVHRERYRPEGKLLLYLYAVARNLCRNRHRDTRRADVARESLEHEAVVAPDDLVTRERRRRVEAAVQLLSPPLREALVLRFSENLPYEDIGRVVGARVSTVRSRVHLGLARLRALLGREDV